MTPNLIYIISNYKNFRIYAARIVLNFEPPYELELHGILNLNT